jgi:uncharacterized protein
MRIERGLNDLQLSIIEKLKAHVQETMPPDPTGHDWPHIWRVLRNAETIHATENGDWFSITLIALTHDLYDHKFFAGTQAEAENALQKLLTSHGVDNRLAGNVAEQVFNLSFKNGVQQKPLSHEGKIVQDADRLEAIGAIGIARAFAFGGYKNRVMNKEKAGPANTSGSTFDHFFEKLLKLYDLLNTPAAKKMAKDRFDFMQEFVKRFETEWNG